MTNVKLRITNVGIVRLGRPIRLGEFRSALFAFGSWSLLRPGRLGPHGRLVVTLFGDFTYLQ